MRALIKAMPKYKISFTELARVEDAQLVLQVIESGMEMEPFTPQLAMALKRLWSNSSIQETYSHRLDFHLHESAKQ